MQVRRVRGSFMRIRILRVCLILLLAGPAWAQTPPGKDLAEAWREYIELYRQGNYRGSLEPARRVYELMEESQAEGDPQLAAATYNYGENLLRVRDHKAARGVLRKAQDRYEAAYGEDGIELLPVLLSRSRADASRPNSRPNRGHLRSARKLIAANFAKDTEEYADHLLQVGQVALLGGQDEDVREALTIYRAVLGARHLKTGQAAMTLGRFYVVKDNRRTATEYLQQALAIFDTSDPAARSSAIIAHGMMVLLLERADERDAATPHCLEMGRLAEGREGPDYIPISRRAPRYPLTALQRKLEGWVELGFTVDPEGYVIDPQVIDYQGHSEFREAATDAVLKFRYAPRFRNGEPVSVPGVKTKITFTID